MNFYLRTPGLATSLFRYGNKISGQPSPVRGQFRVMQVKTVTSPPLSDLKKPAALRESFFVLSRAFYSYVLMLERLLEEFGLQEVIRPGMGHVLFALWESDDVTMTNLAERTGLAPSSLTRLVREMETAELVTRKRCNHDGRAVRVQLTPLGRSLEKMADQVVARLREVVEARMSRAEVEGVKEGLAAMVDNMETYKRNRIVERGKIRTSCEPGFPVGSVRNG